MTKGKDVGRIELTSFYTKKLKRLSCKCNRFNQEGSVYLLEVKWAEEVLEKIHQKMRAVNHRNYGQIPYKVTHNHYTDMQKTNICWWTNGFFAGCLWQLYHDNQEEEYRENARLIENLLDNALMEFNGLHHDVGFMWLHTAVANYRVTDSERSKTRGLHAATLLAGRFNPKGSFIRAWNHQPGWVIIDSMMNLPILFWATEVTNDPRFTEIAQLHADTILENFVRVDGSVGHIGSFSAETGAFIELLAGQGYDADSAWTRGQAWAIYGFALCYKYTKEDRYLAAAKKIAAYFIQEVKKNNYLPLIDFKAPVGTTKIDTSAGSCAACGLLEIAQQLTASEERSFYLESAEQLLQKITVEHGDWRIEVDGLILNASHSYHQEAETHVPMVYGDYFYIEGILRLLNKELMIW